MAPIGRTAAFWRETGGQDLATGFHAAIGVRRRKQCRSPDNVISQKAKYAFKALVLLAQRGRGESLQTDEIAAQAAIPRKFLEQILLQLKANGLVESRRGRSGGYHLV